jgi:hypothetical protein
MLGGLTFLKRIPTKVAIGTLTPENKAVTHSPKGTKYRNVANMITAAITTTRMIIPTADTSPPF